MKLTGLPKCVKVVGTSNHGAVIHLKLVKSHPDYAIRAYKLLRHYGAPRLRALCNALKYYWWILRNDTDDGEQA